nr:MAG TPA: hypothetical protein [Caudoviricetes sp.]
MQTIYFLPTAWYNGARNFLEAISWCCFHPRRTNLSTRGYGLA